MKVEFPRRGRIRIVTGKGLRSFGKDLIAERKRGIGLKEDWRKRGRGIFLDFLP